MDDKTHRIFLGAYSGKSLISWGIRIHTWSKISHTSIFLPDINDSSKPGKMVIEAWAGGVRKIEWNKGHKKRTKIYIGYIECTKEQREKFYNYIYSKIGVKYDYKAILGFLLRMNIESRKGLFCSEFAYEACKKASIDVLLRIKPYQVSPKLLYISPVVKCSEERIV